MWIGTLRVWDVCGFWPGMKMILSTSWVKSNGVVAVPVAVLIRTLTSLVLRFDTLTVTLTETFCPSRTVGATGESDTTGCGMSIGVWVTDAAGPLADRFLARTSKAWSCSLVNDVTIKRVVAPASFQVVAGGTVEPWA